jgi:hypothetical protein
MLASYNAFKFDQRQTLWTQFGPMRKGSVRSVGSKRKDDRRDEWVTNPDWLLRKRMAKVMK